jgi:hypothetical protein
VRPQLPAHLEAVHPGEQDVEHDEVRHELLERPPRLEAVGEGRDLVPLALKGDAKRVLQAGVVLDHRD